MKILVVDDHVLIREAMRGVLRELKGEAAVILEASDSRQAMRQIDEIGEKFFCGLLRSVTCLAST